ncbi:hypothetical protein MMC12_003460 [Toensbergia leucococca]|nr:hypothetical protein [Toensbergia leucococca]
MADPLYELLAPYFNTTSPPSIDDPTTTKYLTRLTTLPLISLQATEPQSLSQSTHSTNLSLQSLSARSTTALTASSAHLSTLRTALPHFASCTANLQATIPALDSRALAFSSRYSRSAENEVLDRRKTALLMARNVDRLSDILELPTLLSSAISSSSTAQNSSNTSNYTSALDLHSHIKRLYALHPTSPIIHSIMKQAETAMQEMTTTLISTLRSPTIKLATALRTINFLRRITPDLSPSPSITPNNEGSLGALFLICRLATLTATLSALSPLRALADQETSRRQRNDQTVPLSSNASAWSGGQQTERYLKRYIEVFREQSFAIISMYKSIFPASPDTDSLSPQFKLANLKSTALLEQSSNSVEQDPLLPLPSALSTFPLHLLSLLTTTLSQYLPNIRDKSSRESLLTQVLYCAGSLGRLGGDFSMVISLFAGANGDGNENENEEEWVEVMKKHRELAGRLEALASGVGVKGGRS